MGVAGSLAFTGSIGGVAIIALVASMAMNAIVAAAAILTILVVQLIQLLWVLRPRTSSPRGPAGAPRRRVIVSVCPARSAFLRASKGACGSSCTS